MPSASFFGGTRRNLRSEDRCSWVRVNPISLGWIGPKTAICTYCQNSPFRTIFHLFGQAKVMLYLPSKYWEGKKFYFWGNQDSSTIRAFIEEFHRSKNIQHILEYIKNTCMQWSGSDKALISSNKKKILFIFSDSDLIILNFACAMHCLVSCLVRKGKSCPKRWQMAVCSKIEHESAFLGNQRPPLYHLHSKIDFRDMAMCSRAGQFTKRLWAAL